MNRASRLNKTLYSLPVHCLTESDLRQENAKGVMQHFHSPENGHNRFLASLTQQERAILRQLERPALYSSRMKEGEEQLQVVLASVVLVQAAVVLTLPSQLRTGLGGCFGWRCGVVCGCSNCTACNNTRASACKPCVE